MNVPHTEFSGPAPQDTLPVAALLLLAAGMLDAYTYVNYGGVFANAMTGNIVILMIHLAHGDFAGGARYIYPIAAYVCGVAVAHTLKEKPFATWVAYPARAALAVEVVFLGAVALIHGLPDEVVVTGIAFVAATQATAFTRVGTFAFTSVTTSANLRHFAESFMAAVVFQRGRAAWRELTFFATVVGCFFAGALAGAAAAFAFGHAAIWLPLGLLAAAFALCMPWNRRLHAILQRN